jgi:hypothetical protein
VPVRRRNGKLRETVIDVLVGADRPLRTRDIQDAVEATTGKPVSEYSLEDCLHKMARFAEGPIERVARGWYAYRETGHGRDADRLPDRSAR